MPFSSSSFTSVASVNRGGGCVNRSEEHTSELQSRPNLVCRLLLGKIRSPAAPPWPPRTWSPISPALGSPSSLGLPPHASCGRLACFACPSRTDPHLSPEKYPCGD